MFTAFSILLVIGGGLALSALFDNDDDEDVLEAEPALDVDEEGRVLVRDETDFRPEDAFSEDVLITPPDVLEGRSGEPITVDINTLGGDDVLNLLGPDPENEQLLTNSIVRTGGEDDVLEISAGDTVIDTRTGSDRVDLYDWGGNDITLGGANDVLVVQATNGIGTVVDGGIGADIIYARLAAAGTFLGGPGSDTILIGEQNEPLAGVFVSADGGEGADTLIYEGEPVTTPDVFTRPELRGGGGGPGIDTFAIAFSEAGAVDAPVGAETARLDLVEILDFRPGADRIVLDARIVDPSYTVGEISLEVDAGADETRIIIPVTSATEINQELVIYVNGTDVTANDVSFGAVNTSVA